MEKELLIYFMSGTGNSYRAASWSAETAKTKNFAVKLLPLGRALPGKELSPGENSWLGVFYPTHAFTAPWPVIKLALRLPRGKGTKVLISACRAGWMAGSWHLPGIEGTGTVLISLILLLKGYDVRGFQGLDMPSNWQAVHWGLRADNAKWFIARAKVKTEDFAGRIFSGERIYRGWFFIFAGFMLSYVSLMYLVLGRFFLAKIMFADFNCDSCGICWKNCPFGALKPVLGRPYWTLKCESCQRCIAYCPQGAIQTGFLYLAGFYWVFLGVFGFLPVMIFERSFGLGSWLGFNLFYIFYSLVWIWFGYLFLFFGAKIRPLNSLLTWTTPTKFFRRYREPSTSLKDLS
ncbi:MAG: (4Fe-4S)-binding protein [Elusimicrobia bacterium CG08_land_8_20_14_0_20_51_18]|nr:MAG: (4Fe-4S)-binding protein [Elusimicrobia bacterium CG08_land_8_20_14_0_20_51_18]